MTKNLALFKQPLQPIVSLAKVIDPHRSIDENHFAARRLGIGFNRGLLPPRLANRRALSRSIKAFKASRTSAVFLLSPVNETAFSSKASSSERVVRMGFSCYPTGINHSIR